VARFATERQARHRLKTESIMRALSAFSLLFAAVAALPAAPASAVAFAEFLPVGQTVLRWRNNGPGEDGRGGALFTTPRINGSPGAVDVKFRFLLPSVGNPFLIDARFQLFGITVGEPATRNPELAQVIQSGSFSFTNTTAIELDGRAYAAGHNLLSATFVRNRFFRGGLTNDPDTSGVTFTSDFLDFSGVAESGYILELTGQNFRALPGLAVETHHMSAKGRFATLPGAIFSPVPEPASWAMLIAGFGLVGGVVRRQRRVSMSIDPF
jgi:hypothetical protein